VYDHHFADDIEAIKDDVSAEEFVSVGCGPDFATEFESLLISHDPAIPDVDGEIGVAAVAEISLLVLVGQAVLEAVHTLAVRTEPAVRFVDGV